MKIYKLAKLEKINQELIEVLKAVKIQLDCHNESGFWINDEPPNSLVDSTLIKLEVEQED